MNSADFPDKRLRPISKHRHFIQIWVGSAVASHAITHSHVIAVEGVEHHHEVIRMSSGSYGGTEYATSKIVADNRALTEGIAHEIQKE